MPEAEVLKKAADPLAINLTEAEKAALASDQLRRHEAMIRNHVFGFDHKVDAQGRPIEQGIGSGSNKNINHFRALKDAEKRGDEPIGAYDRAVADFCRDYPEQAMKIGLMPAPKVRA